MNGKKVLGGVVAPRRGLVCADHKQNKCTNGVENAQFCNRIGCSGRLNSTKGTQTGPLEKRKLPSPSVRSSKGKEIISNPSGAVSNVTRAKFSLGQSQRRLSSRSEASQADTEMEFSEFSLPSGRNQIGVQSGLRETETGKAIMTDVGSSAVSSNGRARKILPQKSIPAKRNGPLGSPAPSSSRSSGSASSNIGNGSRYGLRNLKCNSISDVIPQGCSASESRFLRRATMKKRYLEGESSSSSREKKIVGHSSDGRHVPQSTRGVYLSEPRCNRSCASGTEETGTSSVRTRKSMNVNSRFRLSSRGDGDSPSALESNFTISQLPRPGTPIGSGVHTSPYHCSPDDSSSSLSSYSLSATDVSDLPSSSLFPSTDIGLSRFINCDSPCRNNMDGLAEVLIELERIERNEDVTYEQLLALETNLFLGSLNIYDQHSEMRLDIDNMSYEELLDLEERMGTVSTALSEEAISRCLKRSIHQPHFLDATEMTDSGDQNDSKCSICQEEYEVGEEAAKLACEHRYHVQCIEQWLRLKNWCPICKASAAATSDAE